MSEDQSEGGTVFFEDKELIGVAAVQKGYGLSVIRHEVYEIGFVPVGHLRNLVRRVGNGEMLTAKE